jgi:transcriptional regulator with XRE-family HTH domain
VPTDIEPFYVDLGQLLSAARLRAGLTQDRLGSKLDPPMTRAAIANIEAGKQRVLVRTLTQLAEALEVDVKTLIPGQDARGRKASKADTKTLQAELTHQLVLSPDKVKALAKQIENIKPRGKTS